MARFAYVMAPPASDLVHALKYEGWPELADAMGGAVAALPLPLQEANGARPLVVPVPTTPARLRRRGFNQSALLAERVASARGIPMASALTRPRGAPSQTALTPSERHHNVRGAFTPAAGAEARVRGKDVLLVDDVLTTGSTASEAAGVLGRMGARSVSVAAFGRALATPPGSAT